MSDLHRILKQARRQAADVEEEVAEIELDPLRKTGSDPLHALPKMLFTWKEAAWVTGISVRSLQRYAQGGQLRVTRIGGNTRIRREDLAQLAKDNLQ